MRAGSGRFILWAVLFLVWVAANSTLEVEVFLTGVVVTGGIAFACAGRNSVWNSVRCSPSAFVSFLSYTVTFAVEMVRANLSVMRIVYAPRIAIRPGIVKIRTRLGSLFGRLSLANTIVLTPGTNIVDVDDDIFFVHCLNVDETQIDAASAAIAGPFEPTLEKVFG